MGNSVYVQFQKVQNYNLNGEIRWDSWCLSVWNDSSTHDFEYESFEEMKEDWKPEKVISNLKHFEILEDFRDTLEHKKGFNYPSENSLSTWIEIDVSTLEE